MFEPRTMLAAGTIDGVGPACLALKDGVSGIPAAVVALQGFATDLEVIEPVLADAVDLLLQAFRADSCSPEAYAALFDIRPDMAAIMFDLALEAAFGDRLRDIGNINEPGALCLISLVSAAAAHEQAAALVAQARVHRNSPGLAKAAWMARCRWAGCDPSITAHIGGAIETFETIETAQASIDAAPLHLDGHRALVRFRLDAHEVRQACEVGAVALTLPMDDDDKLPIASELALVVGAMTVRGELSMLQVDRLRWALASAPDVTEATAVAIEQGVVAGTLPFLDETEAASAAALLRQFIAFDPVARAPAVMAFPMRDGKPHVKVVWLEITNHCNQKCTFCPDMFREDARTWLPLAQVKQLIDQLVETVSVESMQLNSYGEPLLHPNIAEILAYIRERKLPWPTFFTSHGMTLVDKKLQQLSHNYPDGIAISLHNDSQESYEATRSKKIGDYDTLVARITALLRQMAHERAPTHLRLYQMVSNANAELAVEEVTRAAFPDTPERMLAHVRKWEALAAEIAEGAPVESCARAHQNTDEYIHRSFFEATSEDRNHLPILTWIDTAGNTQTAFMSARAIFTYNNLLLEYDPRWRVDHKVVNKEPCYFTTMPSLTIFANGNLGMCCMDLNSTANFGSLSDFDNLHDALTSPQALRMFAQLSNGVAASRGCQICLGGTERLCASTKTNGPARPAGHFPDGI